MSYYTTDRDFLLLSVVLCVLRDDALRFAVFDSRSAVAVHCLVAFVLVSVWWLPLIRGGIALTGVARARVRRICLYYIGCAALTSVGIHTLVACGLSGVVCVSIVCQSVHEFLAAVQSPMYIFVVQLPHFVVLQKAAAVAYMLATPFATWLLILNSKVSTLAGNAPIMDVGALLVARTCVSLVHMIMRRALRLRDAGGVDIKHSDECDTAGAGCEEFISKFATRRDGDAHVE